ncbi:hypothetical protein T10_3076 [Trichinella papuae]|uniref:Uncharacterized protein n=1 Tax=Trichinella papuae TaxID=268474 RepID=A0A0V1N6P8_9BILA|nr:hypothetical protein T10_3076 [Trichinella papuae]
MQQIQTTNNNIDVSTLGEFACLKNMKLEYVQFFNFHLLIVLNVNRTGRISLRETLAHATCVQDISLHAEACFD